MGTCENCKYSKTIGGALACMGQKGMPCVRPTDSCDSWKTMKQTNADRIRGMSDEELSIALCRCGCPPTAWDEHGELDCPKPNEEVCEEVCGSCWLDWLKQEVTNNITT